MYQQINLYQPILGHQRHVFSAPAMAKAVAIVAIALLGIYAWGLVHVLGLEAEVAQLEEREVAYASKLESMSFGSDAERLRSVNDEIVALNREIEKRSLLVGTLQQRTLGSSAGFAPRIEALARRTLDGIWLTEIVIDGPAKHLKLAGLTEDPDRIPDYLQGLSEDAALTGTVFHTLEISRDEERALTAFEVASVAEREATAARSKERQ